MIQKYQVGENITLVVVRENMLKSFIKDALSLGMATLMVAFNVWYIHNNWVLNILALLLFLSWALKQNQKQPISKSLAIRIIEGAKKYEA